MCGSGLVTLGDFGVGPLRENAPGIFMPPRARWLPASTRSRVEIVLKTVSVFHDEAQLSHHW